MKRFVSLLAVLLFSLPVGMSMVGCGSDSNNYCPGTNNIVHINQVFQITLQPQYSPISLAYGQTRQLGTPVATNCTGSTVAVSSFTYGTTNPSLVDISPAGNMCAGTWEKNKGGNIPDYTICDPPAAAAIPTDLSQSYSKVTASAQSVTSNQVEVYVHPVATSAVLYPSTSATACSAAPVSCGQTAPLPTSCISQGLTTLYCAVVCSGTEDITAALGQITFTPADTSIVTFDSSGNAKAGLPGATVVTATASGTNSTAGVFSTCAPASIALQVNGTNATSTTINPNNTRPLTATVYDVNGVQLTGLKLSYSSTSPKTLVVSTGGVAGAIFAGAGDIYAACLPPYCNPSPTGYIGQFGNSASGATGPGNGQPLTSNPVRVTSPGVVGSNLYAASFQTPYVSVVNTASSAAASPFKLPYTPNSMVLSRDGGLLAFGSDTELMFVTTSNNSLTLYNKDYTGKALALSPDDTQLIFTDPTKNLIYLYTIKTAVVVTIGGTATSAQWTPDGTTAYMAGTDIVNGVVTPEEFIYSQFTGFTKRPTSPAASQVAVLTPAVGAFVSGDTTTAIGYCTETTPAQVLFPPSPGVDGPATEVLNSTNDGTRVLGADAAQTSFTDFVVGIPQQLSPGVGETPSDPTVETPAYCNGLPYDITGAYQQYPLAVPTGATLTGVAPLPDSSAAVVTYKSDVKGALPAYVLGTTDTPVQVTLADGAIAPTVAVASDDNTSFYVGTSGDGALHTISVSALKACTAGAACNADVSQVSLGLLDANGNPLAPDAIAVVPIKSLQ